MIHVRLPEVLADKLDRLAKADGMNTSELVRQALREYIAHSFEQSMAQASAELRPALEAVGVTEETATDWYQEKRKYNIQRLCKN